MLHIYGDRQLDRVPTHSRKLREMAFPWKIREISGIYQAPQGMFENNKIQGCQPWEIDFLTIYQKLPKFSLLNGIFSLLKHEMVTDYFKQFPYFAEN